MANYLFIASREPDETFGDDEFTSWVTGLKALGHQTTVFLTQNSVIAARKGAIYNAGVNRLLEGKVTVLVDGFYATEKSIDSYTDGVEEATIDQVVDHLMSDNTRTIWH